uniref:C2 domain-containing protein n=1 Tax=Romanomermis culicivorax TaxID=13658 RepID=A0A915IZA0_ROMCU
MTETDTMKLQFTEPDGVLTFDIVQARNLENKDNIIFSGKSDPYVIASVGSQFFKTKTIDNNLNPIWNETFQAVVEQSSGQRVIFEVFDHDPGSSDEFIGRLVLPISVLRESNEKDGWYTLEGVKSGEIRIISKWFNLSRCKSFYDKNKRSPAILMVYLDCIEDLPMIRRALEPSPFVELSLGNDQRQKSVVRTKTCNPVYQQKFTFFVVDINQKILNLEVKDGLGSKRLLGETSIPVEFLVGEEQMELLQHNFDLKLGPHVSSITLSFRLRFLRSKCHTNDDTEDAITNRPVDEQMPSSSYDLNIAGATIKRERQYMKNPLNKNLKSGILHTKTTITPYCEINRIFQKYLYTRVNKFRDKFSNRNFFRYLN